MAVMNVLEAVREAMREEMIRDERVFVPRRRCGQARRSVSCNGRLR